VKAEFFDLGDDSGIGLRVIVDPSDPQNMMLMRMFERQLFSAGAESKSVAMSAGVTSTDVVRERTVSFVIVDKSATPPAAPPDVDAATARMRMRKNAKTGDRSSK
jgi:hypothetical protein